MLNIDGRFPVFTPKTLQSLRFVCVCVCEEAISKSVKHIITLHFEGYTLLYIL